MAEQYLAGITAAALLGRNGVAGEIAGMKMFHSMGKDDPQRCCGESHHLALGCYKARITTY